MIRLYLKILENFVHLIHQYGFKVVLILLVRINKFQFLAQFQVDYLSNPVVSSSILLFHEFAAFGYYMIDRFISINTLPTFAMFLCLIYFRFNTFGPDSVLCYYKKRFNFSSLPFLAMSIFFSWGISLVYHFLWNFIRTVLVDGFFPLGLVLQQVSSNLQVSSHYSVDLSNVVVWMISICPLISKLSSPFNKLLVHPL